MKIFENQNQSQSQNTLEISKITKITLVNSFQTILSKKHIDIWIEKE